jgi:hypothetical protein
VACAANRNYGVRSTVEGNPVGLALQKLMQDEVRWSGTMTELQTGLSGRSMASAKRTAVFDRKGRMADIHGTDDRCLNRSEKKGGN